MAEDPREDIRLVGRVKRVSAPAPGSFTVDIAGKEETAWQSGDIVVEVDGRDIAIDVEGVTHHGAANVRGSGTWREVGGQLPLAADHAPPFKRVAFTGIVPAVDDIVAIYGLVLERDTDEAGYREAPTTTATRVRARLIARGDRAVAELERAVRAAYPVAMRPAKRDPRMFDPGSPLQRLAPKEWIGSAVALAAAIAIYAMYGQLDVALGFVACALVARPGRARRSFRTRAEPTTERPWRSSRVVAALPWALPVLLIGIMPETGWTPFHWILVVWLALLVVFQLASLRELEPYRRVLAAASWNGELGDAVVLEGVVRDPTPVVVGSASVAVGRVENWSVGMMDSDPNTLNWSKFHNEGTFLVDAKAGVVEIDPDETVWASTVTDKTGTSTYELHEVIPIGGNVIAAGSLVAGEPGMPPRLRARGAEPAIVFATSALGEPRAIARLIVHHAYITLVGLALLFAAVSVARG